jgi:hypothetical protein
MDLRALPVGLAIGVISASVFAADPVTPTPAASGDPNARTGFEWHGSQVAADEWLPISLGAGAGFVAGSLTGWAADPQQTVWGPLLGGLAGGATGGFAGAWFIREVRNEDTRLVGTLTGAGVGLCLGLTIYAQMEPNGRALETVGKYSALAILPALGALAGNRIANYFIRSEHPPIFSVVPSVGPLVGRNGADGVAVSLSGAFL